MKKALETFSPGVTGITLTVALILWVIDVRIFSPDAQISRYLAIFILALGNLLVLAINCIYWWRYGAPLWLRCVVMVQALVALSCVLVVAIPVSEDFMQAHEQAKSNRVDKAIQTGDIRQFIKAREACGESCADGDSLNWQLRVAARYNALQIASELVRASAKVTYDRDGSGPTTCEGMTLQENSALIIAVAHDNAAMTRLLLPASDASNRRQALWAAAQMDRLDMAQLLVQAGVPLNMDIYGKIRRDDNSVLVAAASAAAVHVGQWLVETHHMPVNAEAILSPRDDAQTFDSRWTPLLALYYFVNGIGAASRAGQFRDMLVKHGADLATVKSESDMFLEDAVDHGLKDEARFFLDAGAKLDPKDVRRQKILGSLLAGTEKTRDIDPVTLIDCIKD